MNLHAEQIDYYQLFIYIQIRLQLEKKREEKNKHEIKMGKKFRKKI
jgi:hypothetical protein